jgi:predicted transcriptional regulator
LRTINKNKTGKIYAGRSRWKIILDVLRSVYGSKDVKKTHIMMKANLDSKNFEKYSVFLLESGFISDGEQGIGYQLTEKGRELLRRLTEVDGFLGKNFSNREDLEI